MSWVLLFLAVSSPSARDANSHARGQAGDVNAGQAEGRLVAKLGPRFLCREDGLSRAWLWETHPWCPMWSDLSKKINFFSPLKLAKEPWQMKQNLSVIPAGQGCGR